MRFYSLERPIGPGVIPEGYTIERFENFPERVFTEDISRQAWGWVEFVEEGYNEILLRDYGLIPETSRIWWSVILYEFKDGRKKKAHMGSFCEMAEQPESTTKDFPWKTLSVVWFGSKEAAEDFIRSLK